MRGRGGGPGGRPGTLGRARNSYRSKRDSNLYFKNSNNSQSLNYTQYAINAEVVDDDSDGEKKDDQHSEFLVVWMSFNIKWNLDVNEI